MLRAFPLLAFIGVASCASPQGEPAASSASALTTTTQIYTDAVQSPWSTSGWNFSLATQTSIKQAGTSSLAVTFNAVEAGFCFEDWSRTIPAGAFTNAVFYIHPGATVTANQRLLQVGLDNGTWLPLSSYLPSGGLVANTWNLVRVPIASLSPGAGYHRITIHNGSTATNVSFSIDSAFMETVTATPAPVISSFASSPNPSNSGDTVALTWSATNATSYTVNGNAATSGVTYTPTTNTTYTLVATGAGGTATATVNQTVKPKIASFAASPTSVTEGGTTVLTWVASGATSYTINGTAATSGTSYTVNATTTYTLVASGAGGTASASITVTATPPVGTTTQIFDDAWRSPWSAGGWGVTTSTQTSIKQAGTTALKVDYPTGSSGFKAYSTTVIAAATYKNLVFSIYAPGAVTASQRALDISVDTNAAWVPLSQFLPAGGLVANTWMQVSIPISTINSVNGPYQTFALRSNAGSAAFTIYVDSINVNTGATPPPAPTATLAANPASISAGASSTLTWTTQNATSVTLTSVSNPALNGSASVSPAATTTYTLSATGAGGTTTTAATVTVTTGVITPADPGAADYATAIDTQNDRAPISRLIYGYNNYGAPSGSKPKNLTFDRLGGDRMCTYNWEINSANTGGANHDPAWYYVNNLPYLSTDASPAGEAITAINRNSTRATSTMIVLPLGSYAAKDHAGYVDYTNPGYLAGRFVPIRFDSGLAELAGPATPDTTDGFVNVDEYVNFLRRRYSANPNLLTDPSASLIMGLDNEPEFWDEVFPIIDTSSTGSVIPRSNLPGWTPPAGNTTIGRRTTSDELIARVKAMGMMLRRVAPAATIVGPSQVGFYGLEVFGMDPQSEFSASYWFADKFLAEMQAAHTAGGKRLLDVYDFHFYSDIPLQGTQIGNVPNPITDADFDTIVQAPRTYWDPTFDEGTWITQHTGGPLRLIPRMNEKIALRYPGTKLGITEYYPGGGANMAGGIAEADILGIFGKQKLHDAALWPLSFNDSEVQFVHGGMKMYRDYDGASGSFGDTTVRTTFSNTAQGSAYASVDASTDNRVVVVLINKQKTAKTTSVRVTHTRRLNTAEVYTLSGTVSSPVRKADIAVTLQNALIYTMPARSVTTLVLKP